ncbi:hypothetical protein [Cellulosimicrobium funkei]|uniref:hypothetical protein n=1 Tax=Cellulosimicrobium funkei TaxID=264251 RepID=UPI00341AF7C0
MSWTPTDEQVEKAAEALWDAHRDRSEDPPWGHPELHAKFEESYRVTARAVLVAVGPSIAADAWDDLYSSAYSDTGYIVSDPNNPYREQEAR